MTASNPNHLLQVRSLHKRFGELVVLAGVSLEVPRGCLCSVVGPSGTGKSVFLKCLAGVLQPDAGEIIFDGMPLDSSAATWAEFRRRCSFLFQSNALFDSLTAMENVALPLEQTTDLPNREIRDRSRTALRQLDLENHLGHYPAQLSGGMQKRLALARAIVTRPELVFFDEPTAGLDPLRRNSVFKMIAKYQRQFGFTAVIVTHDVPEALATCDRVAYLDRGHIHFEGTPAEFSASEDSAILAFRDSAEELGKSIAMIRNDPNMMSSDL